MSLVFLSQDDAPLQRVIRRAAVVELADARDLKSLGRDTIPVRSRSAAPEDPLITGGLHVAALRALSESVTRVVRREYLSRATLRRSTARQRESRTACVSPYILAVPSLRAARSLLTIPVSGTRRPPDCAGGLHVAALRALSESVTRVVRWEFYCPRNASQIHGTATRVPHGGRFTLHPRCSVASRSALAPYMPGQRHQKTP